MKILCDKMKFANKFLRFCSFVVAGVLYYPETVLAGGYNVVWQEDFGVVEDSVVRDFADPNMSVPGHKLAATFAMGDGYYGITNSTSWCFIKKKSVNTDRAYHFVPGRDHTGNKNGAMLVVNADFNAKGLTIYENNLDLELCGNHKYRLSMFLANVSSATLNPLLTIEAVNVKDPLNPVVLESYEVPEDDVAKWPWEEKGRAGIHHKEREWTKASIEFEAKDGDKLQIIITNNQDGGGGNDFAVDDIMLERYDEEEIPHPEIASDLVSDNSTCIPSYSVNNSNLLTSWKKIYDEIYFLWQYSTDDGYTWTSIPEASGIEKTSLQRQRGKNGKEEVYRLIITGSNAADDAKKKAEDIAKNGTPTDACEYFSISNIIAQQEEKETPTASVGIDKDDKKVSLPTYDCTKTDHTIDLLDSKWTEAFSSQFSFLWQYSDDACKTWNDYTETDKSFIYDESFEGRVHYRAILASSMDVARQVAKNGKPNDQCVKDFYVTNSVSIQCEIPCEVPVFETDDAEQVICSDQKEPVTWSVKQTNSVDVEEMEWYFWNVALNDWTLISGENGTTLSVDNPKTNASYLFLARNGKCVSDSLKFNLTVNPALQLKPVNDITACVGDNIAFRANVQTELPVTYIWNGVPSSNKEYDFSVINKDESVTLTVTDGVCVSPEIKVNIIARGVMPAVEIVKLPEFVCEGEDVKLEVNAKFPADYSYTWMKGDVVIAEDELATSDVAAATDDSYLSPLYYTFVVKDGECSAKWNFKTMVEKKTEVSLSSNVNAVCENDEVSLIVSGYGPSDVLMWSIKQKFEGDDDYSDVPFMADPYTFNATKSVDFVAYVEAGLACAEYYSEPVHIKVEKKAVVELEPLPTMVCEGTSVNLVANAQLSADNTFAWRKNGELLSDSELSLSDKPAGNDVYTFTVNGNLCPDVVSEVSTNVEKMAELELSASDNEVCEGTEVDFSVKAANAPALVWKMKQEGESDFVELGESAENIKRTADNSAEFVVSSAGEQVCPSTTSNSVMVAVEKKAAATLEPLPDIVCRGEVVHLVADAQLTSANKVSWLRNGTLVSVDHLSIDEMPNEDATYTFVIKGDKCPAVEESVSTRVEQRPHIELDHYNEWVCVNSEGSVWAAADNTPGFVWMQKKKNDEEYTILPVTGNKLSFFATESVDIVASTTGQLACQSVVTAPLNVYVEDSVRFDVLPIPDTVCPNTEIVLKSNYLSSINVIGPWSNWYKGREWTIYDKNFADGESAMTLVEPVSDDEQLTYIPKGNAVFELVIEGVYCPRKVFRDSVYVVQPFDISLSAEKELVCEGETPKLEVDSPKNFPLVWKKRVGNEPFEEFDVETLGGLEETTSFIVTSRETDFCPENYSNSVSVEVEQKAAAEIADLPQLVCEGGEVKLDATMQLTKYNAFKWLKDGQPLSAEKQVTDVLTGDATYQLVVEGTECPAIEVEKSVQIEKMPSVEVGVSSALVCKGDPLTLNATAENATGVKWMRKTAGGSAFEPWEGLTDMKEQIVADQTSTVMAVTTGQQVCAPASSNEVVFEVETPAEVAFTDFPPVVCEGSSLVVDASVVAGDCSIYQWTVNDVVVTDTLGNKHAPLSLPGITVNFNDNITIAVAVGGRVCPAAEAELQVAVEKKQILGLSVSDSVVCRGNSIELSSDYAYADGLVWESKPTSSEKYHPMGSATASIEGLPEVSTTYRVSARSELGCVEIPTELEVRVDEPAGLKVVDDFAVCEGDVALLSATTALPSDSVVWTVSGTDEVLGTEAKISLTPEASTSYSVVSYRGVCREEQEVNVKVVEIPRIAEHEDLGARSYRMIVDNAVEPVMFDYGNAEGKTVSDVLNNAIYGKTYNIKVMNDYGCASAYQLQVPAFNLDFPLYFYQGDENWKVGNLERYTNTTLSVFDRYGKLLFEMVDATEGWNGEYNGNPLPSTDYWYVVDIPEIDAQYSGHFTLLRR